MPKKQPLIIPPPLHFSIGMLPPSANHMWRTYRGRTCLTNEAKGFRAIVEQAARAAAEAAGWRYMRGMRFLLAWRVDGLNYTRDLDNCNKLLQDGIAKGLGFNDAYIDSVTMVRGCPAAAEAVSVSLLGYIGKPLTLPALAAMLSEAA